MVACRPNGKDPQTLEDSYQRALAHRLPPSHEPVRSTDIGRQGGVDREDMGRGSAWRDLYHDGWLDLFAVGEDSPGSLDHNNGDGTFADVTFHSGLGNTAKGHGPSMADYDNDGDLDIYAPQGGMGANPGDMQPNSLYRNSGNSNHWLIVEVIGAAGTETGRRFSNRDGVGAKVSVRVGETLRYAEVSGGGGFGVTNSLPLRRSAMSVSAPYSRQNQGGRIWTACRLLETLLFRG